MHKESNVIDSKPKKTSSLMIAIWNAEELAGFPRSINIENDDQDDLRHYLDSLISNPVDTESWRDEDFNRFNLN